MDGRPRRKVARKKRIPYNTSFAKKSTPERYVLWNDHLPWREALGKTGNLHGKITSHLPLRGNKGNFYEGGIRVPLIVKWPGVVKPASTCNVPVISTDYYPTLLAMNGLDARPEQHLDGRSLVPLLKKTGTVKREALYWHYPNYIGARHPGGARPCSVIRQGDWKLIESFENNRLELFNLKDDLGEQVNLAAKMPAKAKALQRQLAAWRAKAKVQMPKLNSAYQPPPD